MRNDNNTKWLPLVLIAGALAVWGGVLGLGAYWAPVGVAAGADIRKFLVLATTTGGFLLFWGFALMLAARRARKKQELKDAGKDQTSAG